MDSPISAFAVYKTTRKPKQNKQKRKNKHNKSTSRTKTLHQVQKTGNETKIHKALMNPGNVKKITENLKQKRKKSKKTKIIEKKKLLKKKEASKKEKSTVENMIQNGDPKQVKKRSVSLSESDDVPMLIPVSSKHVQESIEDSSDVDSQIHSSSESFDFTPVQTDSVQEGYKVFKWMISPYNPDDFLKTIWEKTPLHIIREKPLYYKELISTPVIDDMLRNENIQFTKNIDVTSYVNGKRETHNPEGRAHPHLVWDFYLNGCSIRLLNPQTYIPKLHVLNATMQEFFNSFVGANAYLTPPDSQGFAPHYDDIEAFILQTEGKKLWRVYKPLSDNEVLPRFSSKNFDQNEIGEPVLEVTLEAGDMLYFPRGYIHQGVTIDGEHSLHVTISMYQKHSWADLFEKMIPAALHLAINENVELRRGLPFDLYKNFGLVNSDVETPRKQEITKLIELLFDKIKDHLPIDEAVDQMHKNFLHAALPPVLNDLEKAVTVYGDSDVMVENGKVINRVEMELDTRIRLLRKNILRMVSEEDCIRIYYYAENSLEYHGYELPFIDIDEELAPAIETLIVSYPDYVSVENLQAPNDSDKLQIADALWGRGLIMTEYPLNTISDD